MRKIFYCVIFFTALLSLNFCHADSFENNPDYQIISHDRQGRAFYFYKPSLNVHLHNPPHYRIEGAFVHVEGGRILSRNLIVITYNYDTKKTYRMRNGILQERKTDDDSPVSVHNRAYANALFQAAYGMKFYDGKINFDDYKIIDYDENGGIFYFDPASLNVHEHRPPYYRIEGKFFHVVDKKIISRGLIVLVYDYNTKKVSRRDGETLTELVTDDGSAEAIHNKILANTLFEGAYNMKFFEDEKVDIEE